MRTLRAYIMTLAALCSAIIIIAVGLFVSVDLDAQVVRCASSTSANTEFRNGQLSDFCLPSNSLYSAKIPTERCRTLTSGGLQYAPLGSFSVPNTLFGLNIHNAQSHHRAYEARGVEYYIYTLRRIII